MFNYATTREAVYRQALYAMLDAFLAASQDGVIVEWSPDAARLFGWSGDEVLGRPLVETLISPRDHAACTAILEARKRPDGSAEESAVVRIELLARRRNGTELPVELTVVRIDTPECGLYVLSARDLSGSKALEDALQRQAGITASVVDSMAGAVVVADASERLIVVNPAAQALFGLDAPGTDVHQSLSAFELFHPDGITLLAHAERPICRALRGEHADDVVAMVRRGRVQEGVWVRASARPLRDSAGHTLGAVAVFHDISEQRRREEAEAQQARRLHKQASLLDLARDAILTRTTDDVITYWNRSAERLYQYTRDDAVGQVCHLLLKTRFPLPREDILAIVHEQHYWEGELVQTARDGSERIVFSKWALDLRQGRPYRYLETNADITDQVRTERALRQSQEDFRQLVESSTDYAIMTVDVQGNILSWNSGAERIIGVPAQEAIGRSITFLFTSEDRDIREPLRELTEARTLGRAEDDRWHLRRDGTRFWATGVVTPLHHPDGSLRGYLKIMRDQTSRRLENEETYFLAHHDALTGLPNRVNFSNRLHETIAQVQRSGTPLALLLLDLDRFKYVNDTFGHHIGDLLLKEVAQRLLSTIRETDFVARLGGDEFVVVQADASQPNAAETLARKLVLELGRPYRLDAQEVISGTSIGVCFHPKDGDSPVELLKRADLALYRAKNAGRCTYQLYTPELVSQRAWKRDREAALRMALDNHQFELYYQPSIDLASWQVSTVEALLRWNASERETVLPSEFMEIAERTGLIVEIGEWALREAAHQTRRWQRQGLTDLRLSVNCSARQFSDPRFVALIPSILRDAGISLSSLELEVPEAMLARHPEIKEQLSELRRQGIRLTIDNFGTGATALSDLKDFNIDVLKIDKAFVQHLPHRREDSAITSAIINLAHNLGVKVVAGGVETPEQLAYLKARNCTGAQGFLFSPPVPAMKFEELILSGVWSRINRAPTMPPPPCIKDLH